MRFLNEDIKTQRQIVDIGVIVLQEMYSSYENKVFGFLEEGKTPLNVKFPFPVFVVKSLFSNVVYRNCIACSELGSAGYKEGDIVVLISFNDLFFLILTKIEWLSQKKFEMLEKEVSLPDRKVISNERSAIILEPSGQVVIKFRLGEFNYSAMFGGYTVEGMRNTFFSLVSSDKGEIFKIYPDGSLDVLSLGKIKMTGNRVELSSNSFLFKAIEEKGSVVYEVNNMFRIVVENQEGISEINVSPSEYVMEFGKNKQFKVFLNGKDINEGWIFVDFSGGLKIEADGLGRKFYVYTERFDDDKIERIAKAETLKEELNRLRNELQNFINKYNSHTHTGNLGFPTSPPSNSMSNLSEFTNKWFSETVEVE